MVPNELAGLPNREELIALLQRTFPDVTDATAAEVRGGRKAALAALERIEPVQYDRTRNFLSGAVTQLSPYLRHGVLTLAEVRDCALAKAKHPEDATKLIQELAWRDYWQRLYVVLGADVWRDLEAPKTGYKATKYQSRLPQSLIEAKTTLACMDAFSEQLQQTGYLHNHARMWMAAYVVHWLKVRWQAGAHWFLSHLLDGDPASNNLSWQWVASTFSAKPYIFNRENLGRYTAGKFCAGCVHSAQRSCPFEADYEHLSARLFPQLATDFTDQTPPNPPLPRGAELKPSPPIAGKPLLWVHSDGLNPAWPQFALHPEALAIFMWDRAWIADQKISLKRLVFLGECLAEMPTQLDIRVATNPGDAAKELIYAANQVAATHIVAARTPDPHLLTIASQVERHLPVVWVDPPPFVQARAYDLKRFSRYWSKAQASAMYSTPRL